MANVTGYVYKNISTSIGDIQCIVYTIDEEIENIDGKQYTMVFPTSVYHAQNFPVISEGKGFSQPSISANFSSDYISYNISDDEYIFKYYIDGNEQSRNIDARNAVNACWIQAVVYVGTNGIYTSTIRPPNSFIFQSSFNRTGTGVTYVSPTNNSFGYYRKSDESSRSITVNHFTITNDYLTMLFSGGGGDSDDPYEGGGNSGSGGGGGNFSDQSDNVGFPPAPEIEISNTGFIRFYAPSSSQLQSMSAYMWDTLNLDNWKKIVADPMDVILGLTLVPCPVSKGSAQNLKVGNINTDVSMTTLASQTTIVDMGSVMVDEYWGSYLDYDPYTTIAIYLPFIGWRDLKADDVMGKEVDLQYYVDVITGSFVAHILCGEQNLYSFSGAMGYQVPVTSNSWSNFLSSILSIAGNITTLAASGGKSAPSSVPSLASNAVNMFKQSVAKSGSISGASGFLGHLNAYLAITRPRQALPKDQNKYIGYPSLITTTLADLSGYTIVKEVHLENVNCTESELQEIESLLKRGVII